MTNKKAVAPHARDRVGVPEEIMERRIYLIRRQKVMLDSDLAELYLVETKALNRAVKRNRERFPKDFMFRLTPAEVNALRCQFGTSKGQRGGTALPAMRLYGTGRGDAFQRLEQPASDPGQHRYHAGFCQTAWRDGVP